jgi:hypothetical protein
MPNTVRRAAEQSDPKARVDSRVFPSSEDARELARNSRLMIEQHRAYLRVLTRKLAETQTLIERAVLAHTVSTRLLADVNRRQRHSARPLPNGANAPRQATCA